MDGLIEHFIYLQRTPKLRCLTHEHDDVAGIYADFYRDDKNNYWLFFEFVRSYAKTRYIAVVPEPFASLASRLKHDRPKYSNDVCVIAKKAIKHAVCWQALYNTEGKARRVSAIHKGGLDLDTFFLLSHADIGHA